MLANWRLASSSSRCREHRRGRSGSRTQQSVSGGGRGRAGTLEYGGQSTLGGVTLLGIGNLGGGVVYVSSSDWPGGQNMASRCASVATVESPWVSIGVARWGRSRIVMRSWIMEVSALAKDGKDIFTS